MYTSSFDVLLGPLVILIVLATAAGIFVVVRTWSPEGRCVPKGRFVVTSILPFVGIGLGFISMVGAAVASLGLVAVGCSSRR